MKKTLYSMLAMLMAAFTFSSCEDVPMPYDDPNNNSNNDEPAVVVEPSGSGTKEDPFNVAAIIDEAEKLAEGESSSTTYYFKGIVKTIKEEYSSNYGNGTFYIADASNASEEFYVYRALYLGNKKFTDSDTQIKEGDEVIICGTITNYNGTLETAQNGAYLYSLNGVTAGGDSGSIGTPSGEGTLASPYNVAAALQYTNALAANVESDKDIYIKGIVTEVKNEYDTTYGNGTFYISDDATASNQFYVFRALYLGNVKYTDGTQPKVGDEVIICGKVTNYYGNTPETVANKAYLYSLNGNTGGSTTPDTPTGGATGDGSLSNPFNCVTANEAASKLEADAVSEQSYYIKGKIASIKENYSTQYGNASFYISDDGTTTNQFYVFRTLYLNNVKYESGTLPQVGDDVVIYGQLTNYKGNTPETAQNKSYLYSLTSNGGSSSGGGEDNPAVGDGITVSGTTVTLNDASVTAGTESITVDLSTLGYENAQEITTITLSDGTTIDFDKNGETNGPKYYNATKGIRVYKNNIITFNGKAKIATIVLQCDSYNGTDYVGNETATMSVDGNKVVYTNVFTGTSGGGTQLRIKTITITYAQ